MRGKVRYIDDKWVVEYTGVSYSGGNPNILGSYSKTITTKTLPLHPENVEIFDVMPNYVRDGDSVKFKQVLVNPMGREVDPNDLGQNHSSCVWYAKLLPKKKEQKQKIIDIMKSDEELGLYDENSPGYNRQAKLVNDLAKEIKIEDVFNNEKREGVKRVINRHKILKGLSLVNPLHLQMTSNGHGEFPDGYELTEKGIQYIIEKLNKEEQKEIENDWEEILFDFIDFYPCILPHELFEWLEENYEIPKKKNGKD